MAAQKFYLHVGSPKTGTTFLQQVLWSQRETAAAQGLHLPMNNFFDHFMATLDLRGMAENPAHPPEAKGMWNRMAVEARKLPGSVLISHELFAAVPQDSARTAIGYLGVDVEVHLDITARDLVRQFTAEWQEHVKHRSTDTLAAFVARLRDQAEDRAGWFWLVQDYARVAQRWAGKIDPSHVHIVTVPPRSQGGNVLWERFAGLLGLDAGAFDLESSRTNTSLGVEQSEVLRLVNQALGDRLPMPGPYPAVAKDVLAHQILARRGGERLSLSPEDAAFAAAESARIAESLDAAGYDIVGSLDELVPTAEQVAAASSPDAYAAPAAEQVAEEALAAVADLLVIMSARAEASREQSQKVEQLHRNPLKAALNQVADERPAVDRARNLVRRFRS